MDLLVTERLLLRQWAEADLPSFFDIYSRDEVTRWLGPKPRRPVTDPDEARRGLERWRDFSAGLAAPLGLWAIVPLGPDNTPSQAVATRLGMRDEGTTDRWFGLTTRQYRTG